MVSRRPVCCLRKNIPGLRFCRKCLKTAERTCCEEGKLKVILSLRGLRAQPIHCLLCVLVCNWCCHVFCVEL